MSKPAVSIPPVASYTDRPTTVGAHVQTPVTPPRVHPGISALDSGLLDAVVVGEARLTPQQGLELLTAAPTHLLGRYADARCRQLHGDHLRTYVIDRNINYTNVCTATCTFCAFRRSGHEADAYTLSQDALLEKIGELVAIGGTQILMQGGMNPELPLEWYTDLLRAIKARFPRVHVHGFSPPEFIEFVNFFNPPGDDLASQIRWVMTRLREAGLDSVPGGGGEIFAAPVRDKIGLGKCTAEAWLTVMAVAHELGMFTSATMMFGHIEGHADRVHHMAMVRDRQDAALARGAGHYVSFISWPFQRENTPLGRTPEWGEKPGDEGAFPGDAVANLEGTGDAKSHRNFGRRLRLAGATEYLRTQALSRLFLDNIYSIGASWVTMGPHIGQVGLTFGANDMGSVMMEENVVSSAGTTYCLDEPVICRLIRECGYTPAQRNNTYDIVAVHDTEASPDMRVTDWSNHRANRLHRQAPKEIKADLTVNAAS